MKKYIFLLIIFLSLTFGTTSFVYGFGVSPPYVNSQILIPGAHFESTVYLSRGEPSADAIAEVTIDAPEISKWITIKQGQRFILPKGEKLVPLTIIIDVPSDAAYKTYLGYIRVRALPTGEGEGGQIATIGGARIDLGLTVTEKGFADFNLKGINIPYFEKGDPLTFLMVIENSGNVKIRPFKVHVDIYDLNHLKLMTTGDVDASGMDFVEPFQTGQIQGSFPIELEVGEYWADIYTYKEENQSQAGEAYKVFFKIVPPGTLKQLSQKGLSEADYKLGLITILMVAVILTWINKDKIKSAFKKK